MSVMMESGEGPDKGRAWVIAFAACIINMILSGISRMIGILYVAVIDEYGVTRQEATIPFSVRNSIRSLAGPVVGLVGQIVGIRTITFCGGLVAALGACLCSIAPNVMWLTILWGGVHGGGFAFANTLFQVIVNQYFEKYRATASGIALSGACVGSLAFPFLFEAIIEKYQLSGAFLILGGVVMHVLPPSLMLCSPPWLKKRQALRKTTVNAADGNETEGGRTQPIEDSAVEEDVGEEEDFRRCSVVRSTSFSDYPEDGIQVLSAEKRTAPDRSSGRFKNVLSRQDSHGLHTNGKCSKVTCISYVIKEDEVPSSEIEEVSSTSVFPADIPCQPPPPPPPQDGANARPMRGQQDSTPVPGDEPEKKKEDKKGGVVAGILSIVRLYKNPVYVLICVSLSTYTMIFIPILTVIVDYGKDKGMSEADGKYLINALAIGDLFGRLCFGWVTDKKFMAIYKFIALCQVMQGVIVGMFSLAASLYTFMLLLALYGMMAGIVLVHFPILVLKYVPPDDQPVGMGSVAFLSGLATFGIPPLIGHFRDKIGSYDGMFYFIGAISLFSGVLWLLEPVMVRKHMKNEAKRINAAAAR